MRQRTIGDWFFLLTFAVPITAAVLLLGLLGLLGIADLCGAATLSDSVWKVFLGTAAGFLGLAFLIRVAVLVAAAVGMLLLTIQRASQGVALALRMAFRGM